MKYLNKTKKTRFKLVIYFGTGILAIGAYAAINSMEGTATVAVGALSAIIAKYMHDETKRPSGS